MGTRASRRHGPILSRASLSDERGQTLLLLGVLSPLLAFALLIAAVDVPFWQSERRHAQTAADFAALAAAKELPGTDAAVVAAGLEYSALNGYDDADDDVTVIVTPRYNEDPNLVEVVIDSETDGLFAGIFGLFAPHHGARAVAEYMEGAGMYAIFANEPSCDVDNALEFNGSNVEVNGRVHTNSWLKISGSDSDFNGEVTYVCDVDNSGSDNEFDSGSPDSSSTEPMPVNYTWADILPDCTMVFNSDTDLTSVNEAWLNDDPDTLQLKDGVYCSNQKLSLSGQGVSGKVTLAAQKEISLSGSDFNLTPYWNDILLFTTSDSSSAMDVSGSGGSWEGIIYAPNGKVKMSGGELESNPLHLFGSIVGNQVQISGSDFIITAKFVSADDTGLRLVE